MVEEPKTATEIARLIKERAYIQLGPWPVDLRLIIFSTTSGWRCGLSPATKTSEDARYREAVLKIARELQSTVALVREGTSDTDKEGRKLTVWRVSPGTSACSDSKDRLSPLPASATH